ncbi:hypothetical protein [Micromonospora sp. NPDC023814]|uniref:hypothetical protein n=1 Tax=Micromonospora sp. NPDC023814 TaxID=3154596 RepID=UPI0033DEF2C8
MTTTPHRISPVRWILADLATTVFGPDHPGADDTWLADLRTTTSRPDLTTTAHIPTIRQAAAAIADVPYRPVVDEHLGLLHIGPQEPAHIHDQLAAVNGINTGGAL